MKELDSKVNVNNQEKNIRKGLDLAKFATDFGSAATAATRAAASLTTAFNALSGI
jgi:hypothetical protein